MLPLRPSFWPSSGAAARWLPATAAAVLWALAAGSALLWWLHLPGPAVAPAALEAAPAVAGPGARAALERTLGLQAAVAAAPDVQKRFALLGVIASGSGRGSALLAVDGQPPQAFVLGQPVAEGWRLDAVREGGVRLAPLQGGAGLDLALPIRP